MRKVFLKKVNFLSPPQFSTVMRRTQFLPTSEFGLSLYSKTDQTYEVLQPNQSRGIVLKWLQI